MNGEAVSGSEPTNGASFAVPHTALSRCKDLPDCRATDNLGHQYSPSPFFFLSFAAARRERDPASCREPLC